jgi:hypothetical protein
VAVRNRDRRSVTDTERQYTWIKMDLSCPRCRTIAAWRKTWPEFIERRNEIKILRRRAELLHFHVQP